MPISGSGETYYAERRYEEAILEYQKVIDRFPQSYKVPAALLKQGLSFLRLGDTEAARILFKKIVKDYPKSEQATTARKYLKRL
ncbi:tetratricopeptide repeat protein, partial [Thermosulfurimonas dismutans]|uniref:tetratricopeptide repeat protein n=1 Tax=Thermosulfurimonas dismutans TaxID=999894 RepID=UPI0012947F4B